MLFVLMSAAACTIHDLSTPAQLSPLDLAANAHSENLLLTEEAVLKNQYLWKHPNKTEADLETDSDFQAKLRQGVSALYVTTKESEGSARIAFHRDECEQIATLASGRYPITRRWVELYPALPGTTPENLFTKHSTKLLHQGGNHQILRYIKAYHTILHPLRVQPTDANTGLPTGPTFLMSFVTCD